ncbi:MAG: EF-P lysine aminoacylase EpmA [Myxococcaceae bacterium]
MKFLDLRHRAKKITRQHFDDQGFTEIDSPILISSNAVEAYIDPVWVGDEELRTSPEIYHKRLLARGCQKIYELGHVFRDEELGRIHLREFTLLEWYRVGASLSDLIQDCEKLFYALAPELFSKPFELKTLEELWRDYAKIDLRQALLTGNLVQIVKNAGFVLRDHADFSDAFHHVMITVIEPNIGQETPCVVTRWPKELAALSRLCEDDCLFAERFEIYFRQTELANAFLELTDPVEQKKRFEAEARTRNELGKRSPKPDQAFLTDLQFIPRTAGIAVGFDRLLMLIAGAEFISDVTNFLKKV